MNYKLMPGERVETAKLDAVGAGDATESQLAFVAPMGCRVKRVSITPSAAVTGHATNRKTLKVINRGSDGTGSAELGELDLVAGVDLTAFNETNIVSGLDTQLSAGDVLAIQIVQEGTGVAIPVSQISVEYTADYTAAP